MIEKAKKNDPGLYTTVVIISCLVALGTIITSIVLWADTEQFLPGFISFSGGALVCWGICMNYYVSAYFYGAAIDKGNNDTIFIRLSFWTGFPGWILVCALPDRGNKESESMIVSSDVKKKSEKKGSAEHSKNKDTIPSTKVIRTLEENILYGNINPDEPSLEEYIDEEETFYEGEEADYTYDEDNVPAVKCPNCGTVHDFDYPKCPNCKYKYNRD